MDNIFSTLTIHYPHAPCIFPILSKHSHKITQLLTANIPAPISTMLRLWAYTFTIQFSNPWHSWALIGTRSEPSPQGWWIWPRPRAAPGGLWAASAVPRPPRQPSHCRNLGPPRKERPVIGRRSWVPDRTWKNCWWRDPQNIWKLYKFVRLWWVWRASFTMQHEDVCIFIPSISINDVETFKTDEECHSSNWVCNDNGINR